MEEYNPSVLSHDLVFWTVSIELRKYLLQYNGCEKWLPVNA